MNFLELSNKKHKALETIKDKLLELIDLGDDKNNKSRLLIGV